MKGVCLAESAVFLCLHTIGMGLLILGKVVVTALACLAGQRDSCTHFLILRSITLYVSKTHKKKSSLLSPAYYNTAERSRQLLFFKSFLWQIFLYIYLSVFIICPSVQKILLVGAPGQPLLRHHDAIAFSSEFHAL